ncbi:hypothetical protein FOA43_004340 [Brettanomyces nanus]|uniref:Uncharacterized protein n=1 Tax=Eeniella nana TaxID=13502 RepID=A0A875S6I3_EENNA|nr:uncharacterized protein FOA43_004340 [Brettanomyces nanus]QPG76946.1 hypothetical protein FOA43_004340 [Brettanomyces nanus]
MIWLGACIPSVAFIWMTIHLHLDSNSCSKSKLRGRFKPIAFTNDLNWQKEMAIIDTDASTDDQIQMYPENFLINDTLNNIVSLIIRDFISNWFSRITTDQTFINDLKKQFRGIIIRLGKRLESTDFSDLLVHGLVPIIEKHLKDYSRAKDLIKNRKASAKYATMSSTKEMDKAIASNYNQGSLHTAVKIGSKSNEQDIKLYLSEQIGKILLQLLDNNEVNSPPVLILVREILTNCVFYPIVSMLSDPDYYNQRIVTKLVDVMKDRDDVKRFRSILDQHSLYAQNSDLLTRQILNERPEALQKMRITVRTSSKAFEKVVRQISRCNSASILKQYRYLLALQLDDFAKAMDLGNLKVDENMPLRTYSKRLQILLAAVDLRSTALKSSLSSPLQETEFDPSTIPKNPDLTLEQTLKNPIEVPYFMEFMENRKRGVLVQFWTSVNALRNPLEEFYFDDCNTAEAKEEDSTAAEYLDDAMSQAEDLRQIFRQHFSSKLLAVPEQTYQAVSTFVNTHPDNSRLYYSARKALFQLQQVDLERMEKTDFLAFRQSDYFIRMLAAGNQSQLDVPRGLLHGGSDDDDDDEVNGDPLAKYDEAFKLYDESGQENVSDTVLKVVEDALNEITAKKNIIDEESVGPPPSSSSSSRLLSKDTHKDLFGSPEYGDESELFDYESDSATQYSPRIFGDSDDNGDTLGIDDDSSALESGAASMSSSMDAPSSEVRVAAPGDLNLTDEINRLETEKERLRQQLLIINSLLRKAELTSNITEVRIMNRSKVSLDREVRLRELQLQQYTMQQSDSGLYKRSKVTIQSYITANEHGHDFILYIIEVQRLSNDDLNVVLAGWMVARRFSQFYKLHKYLRMKYPEVWDLEFPKRMVVMKFQQSALIEQRKCKLERYLQKLLSFDQVCANSVFRDFLSSDVFTLDFANEQTTSNKTIESVNSITSLYNRLWSQLMYFQGETSSGEMGSESGEHLQSASFAQSSGSLRKFSSTLEMKRELSSLDEAENSESLVNDFIEDEEKAEDGEEETKPLNFPFVKPLCDLTVTLFQLDKSNIWLRGRALVIILQRLLGSTIEKVVRTTVDDRLKTESTIFSILSGLQNVLWPDGEFRKHSKERTLTEKSRTKQKARYMLVTFIVDSCSRVFGRQGSKRAADLCFDSFQNELLNKHLTLTLLDEIFKELFLTEKET